MAGDKVGRAKKYNTEEERKEARRVYDHERRERTKQGIHIWTNFVNGRYRKYASEEEAREAARQQRREYKRRVRAKAQAQRIQDQADWDADMEVKVAEYRKRIQAAKEAYEASKDVDIAKDPKPTQKSEEDPKKQETEESSEQNVETKSQE